MTPKIKTLLRRWDGLPLNAEGRLVWLGHTTKHSVSALIIFADGRCALRLWDQLYYPVELHTAAQMMGGTNQLPINELSDVLHAHAAHWYASQE